MKPDRRIRIAAAYDILDDILQRHIELHQPAADIIAARFDATPSDASWIPR